jgi:hypothetical protein
MNSRIFAPNRRRVAIAATGAVTAIAIGCTLAFTGGGSTPDSLAGARSTGAPQSSWGDQLGATTWYPYPSTNLKDPTPAHTVGLNCGAQTTNGTALYPYIVTDGPQSYNYAYQNLSTKSVYVASDGIGHSGDAEGFLTVANRNIHGDDAFSVRYECSTNFTPNQTYIQSVTADKATPATANIITTYANGGIGSDAQVLYEIQYGPAAGDYTNTVVLPNSPMVASGSGTLFGQLTGLTPATTYHYRVIENAAGHDDLVHPNVSADQTFTTATS